VAGQRRPAAGPDGGDHHRRSTRRAPQRVALRRVRLQPRRDSSVRHRGWTASCVTTPAESPPMLTDRSQCHIGMPQTQWRGPCARARGAHGHGHVRAAGRATHRGALVGGVAVPAARCTAGAGRGRAGVGGGRGRRPAANAAAPADAGRARGRASGRRGRHAAVYAAAAAFPRTAAGIYCADRSSFFSHVRCAGALFRQRAGGRTRCP